MTDQPIATNADIPPREYGPLCEWVGRKIALHLQALEPAVYAKEVSALAKRPELLDELASAFHSMLMLKLLEGKRERCIKRNKKAGVADPSNDLATRSTDTRIDELGNDLAYWTLEATLTRVQEEVRRDVKEYPRKQLPGNQFHGTCHATAGGPLRSVSRQPPPDASQ